MFKGKYILMPTNFCETYVGGIYWVKSFWMEIYAYWMNQNHMNFF